MGKKNVEDYLTEGLYGVRRPKEAERLRFLGTLEERIVIALTVGQVMTDSGITALDKAMTKHPTGTQLLINGTVAHRFLVAEKAVANKHQVPYKIVTNTEVETDIGAVLTYDYAINKDNIFLEEKKDTDKEKSDEKDSFFSRIKNWFD